MLQTAAVYPETLAILKKIMLLPEFRQFNLVGGTALALQIGHRISIDLDLFTCEEFDDAMIIQSLQALGELDVLVNTISEHIKNVFEEGELDPGATVRNFRIVQTEGSRNVEREIDLN